MSSSRTTGPSSTLDAIHRVSEPRERMEAIYGNNGYERDALTNYSTPASGSFDFAPSVETLEAMFA
jgi:hypothetical protein